MLIVRDVNWDRVVFEFDKVNLSEISLLAVGFFDSGKWFSNITEDPQGNIYIKVDTVYYHYDFKKSKWSIASFQGYSTKSSLNTT